MPPSNIRDTTPVSREEFEELKTTVEHGFARMDEQFARIDERFVRMDEQFARIDDRFVRMDEQFARIDERFVRIDEQFAGVDARFTSMRTYMDVRFERLEETTRILADGLLAVDRKIDRVADAIRGDIADLKTVVTASYRKLDRRVTALERRRGPKH
jgi:archaellum component FlaC